MPTWTCRHTITAPARPQAIWARLADVERWPQWDHDVRWARLDGALARGTTGTLKPAGGPRSRFIVTRLEHQRRLTDETRLPLARMTFDHELEPIPEGTRLTHRVTIAGPAAPLFGYLIGRRVRDGLPEAMRRLAALAAA